MWLVLVITAVHAQVVDLVAFPPFKSALEALQQINAVSDGLATDELLNFLELNLPKVCLCLLQHCDSSPPASRLRASCEGVGRLLADGEHDACPGDKRALHISHQAYINIYVQSHTASSCLAQCLMVPPPSQASQEL